MLTFVSMTVRAMVRETVRAMVRKMVCMTAGDVPTAMP